MNLLNIFKRKEERNITNNNDVFNPFYGSLNYGGYSNWNSQKALTLSAVYRAVNLISDGIAALQLKVYQIDKDGFKKEDSQNYLYTLLGIEPNSNISRFTFFKTIVTHILLRGNAYILINRDQKFNVIDLQLLESDTVTVELINNQIKYRINGVDGLVDKANMIHIINYPLSNGLIGCSTLTYAANCLENCYNSESHASSFFKNGANTNGFLSYSGGLTPEQEKQIQSKFKQTSDFKSGNPNGITILGGAGFGSNGEWKLQNFSIPPKDAQLLETRAFNILDIARFFNVAPSLLFDNQSVSYNSIEASQIDFLNKTLLPIIEKIENEFVRKLLKPSERTKFELRFDLTNLLRADSTSRAAYYAAMTNIGVLSANQIAKMENLERIEGGDNHYISTNLQDIAHPVVAAKPLDNKLINK